MLSISQHACVCDLVCRLMIILNVDSIIRSFFANRSESKKDVVRKEVCLLGGSHYPVLMRMTSSLVAASAGPAGDHEEKIVGIPSAPG